MATARKVTKLAAVRIAHATPNTTQSKKRIIKSSKKIVADGVRLAAESRKLVNNLYKDGNKILQHAGNDVKEYSDEVVKTVQKNPITSLLVASGLGAILSLFLRRK